ncbi:MAG: N-acetylmuramoyl-L-alanine amidase [Candidatus Sumerlaeia bacterium]|nr:N-acetylmuramoyl-L-alanine amidase [Candidatus Sumerlaeia bacterium]
MKLTTLFKAGLLAGAIALATPGLSSAQTKVYIDPGHGGSDPGAVNSTFGTQEAARVLYTGLKTRDLFNADSANTAGGGNWSIRMSRTTNVDVSLSARSVDSNNWGSARFVSIHQNAFNQSANGTETFSYASGTTGAALRDRIQEEAIIAWGLVNRGSKTANYAVLRDTTAPAALTEMGFIDSSVDHPKCSSNVECDKYALAILYGLQRNYGFAKFNPSTPATVVTVDNTDAGFTAPSTAWFTGTSIAGYLGTNYHTRATQAISDAATWSANLPTSGSYKVEARWTAASNRAASAPYVVSHAGGNTTVNVNQQANNGVWITLGTWNFNAGTAVRVSLSCWTTAGFFVVADGVRFTKQ